MTEHQIVHTSIPPINSFELESINLDFFIF